MRINVSNGPKPVTVPERDRQRIRSRRSRRSRASASRSHATTSRIRQRPGRSSARTRRRHATEQGLRDHAPGLQGPKTSQVPDVTSQTEADATAQLQAVRLRGAGGRGDVDDQSLDGRVLSQDPRGRDGRQAGHVGDDRRRPLRAAAAGTRRPTTTPDPVTRAGSASPSSPEAARASTRSRSRRPARCWRRSTRSATRRDRRDRPRRPLGARAGREQAARGACPRRCRYSRTRSRRRRSAPSTSSCPSCTARSARTAPCRACWSWRTCRTWAPGVAASALCMDKDLFKAVLRDRGIPVARNVDAAPRRRDRESLRLSRLRQAGAARLVGRDLEGP